MNCIRIVRCRSQVTKSLTRSLRRAFQQHQQRIHANLRRDFAITLAYKSLERVYKALPIVGNKWLKGRYIVKYLYVGFRLQLQIGDI